ncbi:MAG: GHMP kinase [Aigarchaeota archaeon]|nr:GHMP kinase [Aigarchaeota archaeon]
MPVVPVAVKLRCYSLGITNQSNLVTFTSLNLQEQSKPAHDEFSLDNIELVGGGWFGDYLRAVFKAFRDSGYHTRGMDIALWSEVPIGSGLSSSASLEVSLAQLVSLCLGLMLTKKELAEMAYRAEHDIMGIPCGRLDQYASSYGGVMKLETRPPFNVEQLPRHELIFLIADSGEHRRITSVHPIRQDEINKALKILMDEIKVPERLAAKLGYHYHGPRWEDINEEEIKPFLASLPRTLADRILFTIKMNRSTVYALEIIRGATLKVKPPPEIPRVVETHPHGTLAVLGAVMNYQHQLLRDLYDVSTPRLEELRGRLVESGALGAKISGAGLGGAIIGLVRDFTSAYKIRQACEKSGFSQTWVSTPDDGARMETVPNHSRVDRSMAS